MTPLILYFLVAFQANAVPGTLFTEVTKAQFLLQNSQVKRALLALPEAGMPGIVFHPGSVEVNGAEHPEWIGVEHALIYFHHVLDQAKERETLDQQLRERGFQDADLRQLATWATSRQLLKGIEADLRNDLRRFKAQLRSQHPHTSALTTEDKAALINHEVERRRTLTIEHVWAELETLTPNARAILMGYLYERCAPHLSSIVFMDDYGTIMAPQFETMGLD